MEHHVYFWLKEEKQNPEDRAKFEEGIDALFRVDTIQSALRAVPAKTAVRPVTDNSWDYAINVKFATLADHDVYQDHPIHDVFVADFKDWWAKVEVKDLA